MPEIFLLALAAIDTLHPLIQMGSLSAAIWAANYSVRKWFPGVWLAFEKMIPEGTNVPVSNMLQSLPGVAFGAAVVAFKSGAMSPETAFYGVLSAFAATVGHHLAKASPLPYRGATATPKKSKLKKAVAATTAALLALTLPGCPAPRPPERDPCYLAAEYTATQEALTKCGEFKAVEECPAYPRIEAELQAAQEKCP